ncbi:MAG: glycosyltransferase family 2 protein, partial [Planctomycetota bacterium]
MNAADEPPRSDRKSRAQNGAVSSAANEPEPPPEGRPRFSVVVPVFNEEECIEALHSRLSAVAKTFDGSYEIIYVNDGSRDGSAKLLNGFAADDPNVRVIHFTRNFGQHPAVYAGFDHVLGDIVFTLDADLQKPPEELQKLLEKIESGGH